MLLAAMNNPSLLNIGVLGSGQGSNFQAIADAIQQGNLQARIACVIADVADAFILQRAPRQLPLLGELLRHRAHNPHLLGCSKTAGIASPGDKTIYGNIHHSTARIVS